MNALVISGGGSKGAFAGGIAQYLIEDCKQDYQLYVGTSTGSLLIPFLALSEIEKIKKIYTTIRQEDIFKVSPFLVKKEKDAIKVSINHIGILKQIINNEKSLGDSHNLRMLIKENFSADDFEKIKLLGKELVVTVANFSKMIVEHKSSNDYDYEDFCDWIWASCNMIPLMSLLNKNGEEFGDGGFGNLIPVQQAILQGASNVDVIVLKLKDRIYENPPMHNALDALGRT